MCRTIWGESDFAILDFGYINTPEAFSTDDKSRGANYVGQLQNDKLGTQPWSLKMSRAYAEIKGNSPKTPQEVHVPWTKGQDYIRQVEAITREVCKKGRKERKQIRDRLVLTELKTKQQIDEEYRKLEGLDEEVGQCTFYQQLQFH